MLKFQNNNLQQYIYPFDVYIRYIDDAFMVCDDTTSIDDLSASFIMWFHLPVRQSWTENYHFWMSQFRKT